MFFPCFLLSTPCANMEEKFNLVLGQSGGVRERFFIPTLFIYIFRKYISTITFFLSITLFLSSPTHFSRENFPLPLSILKLLSLSYTFYEALPKKRRVKFVLLSLWKILFFLKKFGGWRDEILPGNFHLFEQKGSVLGFSYSVE